MLNYLLSSSGFFFLLFHIHRFSTVSSVCHFLNMFYSFSFSISVHPPKVKKKSIYFFLFINDQQVSLILSHFHIIDDFVLTYFEIYDLCSSFILKSFLKALRNTYKFFCLSHVNLKNLQHHLYRTSDGIYKNWSAWHNIEKHQKTADATPD
jgi:hypothetical protein